MHPVFATAAKLLGLYLFFQMLLYLQSLVLFTYGGGPGTPVVVQLVAALTALLFSLYLIFGTESVARLVGAPVGASAGAPAKTIDAEAVLRLGVMLIGVYLFSTRLGPFLRDVYFSRVTMATPALLPFLDAVPLILALLLILAPGAVVKILRSTSSEAAHVR